MRVFHTLFHPPTWILNLMVVCVFIGCSKSNGPTPSSIKRFDVTPPKIQALEFHSTEGVKDISQGILLNQPVTSWLARVNLEQIEASYLLLDIEDPDTAKSEITVGYAIYRQDRKPAEPRWKRAELIHDHWKIPISKDTVGRDVLTFVGNRPFICEIKVSAGNEVLVQKITLMLSNAHPELMVEVDPDDISVPSGFQTIKDELSQNEVIWGQLTQLESLSQDMVFKKIWIENKTPNSFYIDFFADGVLDVEQKFYVESWQNGHPVTIPGGTRYRSNAKATYKVYLLKNGGGVGKGGGETVSSSLAKPIPFEGFHSIYELPGLNPGQREGLLILILSDLNYQTMSQGITVDQVSNLCATDFSFHGALKILSAPQKMDPTFYGQELNWNDLTPKYLPHLKLITN